MGAYHVRQAYSRSKSPHAGTVSVLAAITAHADENGLAWPSLTRLARDTRLGVSSVKRALSELETLGELRRFPKGHVPDDVLRATRRPPTGGWQPTTYYHVLLVWPATLELVRFVDAVNARHGGESPQVQVGPRGADLSDKGRPTSAPKVGPGTHTASLFPEWKYRNGTVELTDLPPGVLETVAKAVDALLAEDVELAGLKLLERLREWTQRRQTFKHLPDVILGAAIELALTDRKERTLNPPSKEHTA